MAAEARLIARRSCLVVPGHDERMHAKALAAGADEVVLDLEDAVAADAKQRAREAIERTLCAHESERRRIAIRVNAPGSPELERDLELCNRLARPSLTVVVPKAQDPVQLSAIAERLAPDVGLQALVETPAGLLAVEALARVPRLVALVLGYADLGATLGRRGAGLDPSRWAAERSAVVAAARAAGVQAIDGPYFRLRDPRGLGVAARIAREQGFDGKWAIHPEQVEPLNRAFSAIPSELAWAADVQAAVHRAASEGGAVAELDGTMVDEAMVRRAEALRRLPRADRPETEAPGGAVTVGAPYFEDLHRGQVFESPGLTLTSGHAALHQSIVGDRLRLALDGALCDAVTGQPGPLAHPMLVCDVAIGQSTPPSGRVLGNLFYRGLGARPVALGTTLRTRTEVVALRAASRGRGTVALRVSTTDEHGRPVLDFVRCPLLPARETPEGPPDGPADDLDAVGDAADARALVPTGWQLEPLRESALGPLFGELEPGTHWDVEAGETVTAAPELARLSLNVAMAHTDAGAGPHGERLVYGGHVISVAAAHVTRALPDLATILTWESCDHLGATFEGDVLGTRLELLEAEPLSDGGLVHLRARVSARSPGEERPREVLDWRLTGLMP